MPGKVNLIHLNPDMTFTEQKKKTTVTNVEINKNNNPSFVLGRSAFRELIPRWKRIIFGKKPRELIIYLDGSNACFAITPQKIESFESDIWSRKEKERYINKVVHKAKAEQKMIETWQFYVLAGLLAFILICQLLIMRGVRVF